LYGTAAWLCLVAILSYAAAVRIAVMNRPFHRDAEGVAAYFGILGRDYFRYDWKKTYGVPVQSLGQSNNPPVFYANHPPLVPMLVAGSYGLFGYRGSGIILPPDWQLRLPTVLFTLGDILLIYLLMRRRAGDRPAIISALLFAAAPITLYYGGFPDVVGSQLVFFILLTVAAYERFHDRPSLRNLLLVSAAFFPAIFTDWIACFFLPVLAIHWAFTKPWKTWGWGAAFGAIGTLFFLLAYGQIDLVRHDPMWIRELVARRTVNSATDSGQSFTTGQWFRIGLFGENVRQHSLVICVLAVAWIALYGWRVRDDVPAARLVRLMLGWAALHVLIGRQGVFNHPWWWWPLTPGLAMAAGLMGERICVFLESRNVVGWKLHLPLLAVLFAFANYHTRVTIGYLINPAAYNGKMDYTIQQIGRAIHTAPPDQAVALAESDETIGLWYYGDRPLFRNVWDQWTLQALLDHPERAELPMRFSEPWTKPPAIFVFPRPYAGAAPEFLGYLAGHYRLLETDERVSSEFYIFDLRSPVIQKH